MTDTEKIIAYIEENRVLTLCTARGSLPWAANCFYAFDRATMTLLLMSDPATRHAIELAENDRVAGTITSQESTVVRLRGLQFTGRGSLMKGAQMETGREIYLQRFPIARLHSAPLWAIKLETVKFTNNTLGFGTKLRWTRRQETLPALSAPGEI
ncbi:pyridoxamine 5'-phosphate oxidase family protein [Breoghania sp.]|uniref:pyridoxamine 5'-phosphate oxidase family protein n=1 Tax=Breoghania sp. TaxID=2065378 RepID=UPI0029C9DAA2|nr:pyridoxamine 5'-phosphate oxidase family protein [Breoghania sp.]